MIDASSSHRQPAEQKALPNDLVSELLLGMHLNGIQYRRIQAAPPFGIGFGNIEGGAQFHFIARGPVHLRSPDSVVHRLETGDAVLLPHGSPHELLSSPSESSRDIATFEAAMLCKAVSTVRNASPGVCQESGAVMFSGCMEFDLGGMHPLVGLMPEVMRVDTLQDRHPEMLPILQAMEREAQAERAGFASILSRLADVVSAFIVRGWVECGCGDASGWVEALRDPRLGHVIAAMHREPGRQWTVAELAKQMDSSRSVFAERFLAVTGLTPHRYMTELRMRLATQWIGRDKLPIDVVAQRLGYGSQAAFSRAYKRVTGRPPGAVRAEGKRDRLQV